MVVKTGLLQEVLEIVGTVTPVKDGVIKIQVLPGDVDRMMIQGGDGSAAATKVITVEGVTEQAEVYLGYPEIANCVSELSKIGEESLELLLGGTLTIKTSTSRVEFALREESSFKSVVPPKDEAVDAEVDAYDFRKALATSQKHSDPKGGDTISGSVYLRITADGMEASGTDGVSSTIISNGKVTSISAEEVEISVSTARAKAILPALPATGTVRLKVYQNVILVSFGEVMLFIPQAKQTWTYRERLTKMMEQVVATGSTIEVDRKSFINALSLVSTNIGTDKDSFRCSLQWGEDVLKVSNGAKTASVDLEAKMEDGASGDGALFNIIQLKQMLSSLSEENVNISIMLLEKNGVKSAIAHFEEGNEQDVLMGISCK